MTRATLIVLHVLSAVIGFGAVLVTGVYAALARRRTDEAVRRYFRPGTNWAARVLYIVPLLGVALVATSHGTDRYAQLWLWVSLLLWAGAAGLAQAVVWPGERRLQDLVARTPPAGDRNRQEELDRTCRRVALAAAAIAFAFVATVVLMVARPGGGG